MSNIIPQKPRINQTIWKDIEHNVALKYGRYFGEVWVISGPVFEEPIKVTSSGIPIPSRYYKIIADEYKTELRVIAFLVDNSCPPYTRIKTELVSVDQIEELTGLNFFPDLPDSIQIAIESKPATRLWPWIIPSIQYYITGNTI